MSKARNVQELVLEIAAGANPVFRGFFGPFNPDGYMSQFYPASFSKDGVTYAHAEMWMMASKARLFGDEENLARILKATDPKEAKRLGRAVRNFDPKVWGENCVPLVREGNLLKFGQNPELLKKLLDTGSEVLVEASKFDKIWGIGIDKFHTNFRTPKNWPGQNLLGFVVMDVRDYFAALQG